MAYTTHAYLITCLTNLHVGSEGINYGVVDNLVQRDTISEIPVINSSSLKGALREFFKDKWSETDPRLKYIFGPDGTRNTGSQAGIGHYKFFEAKLLSIPVRSNKEAFYSVTTKDIVENINDLYSNLTNCETKLINLICGDKKNEPEKGELIESDKIVKLEDWSTRINQEFNADTKIGKNVATFDTDTFKKVVKRLPVIARNKLDNGTSKNLWYEEVVPRESRFVFFVSETEEHFDDFENAFKDAVVQIGGNASIGCGYCKITKIEKP